MFHIYSGVNVSNVMDVSQSQFLGLFFGLFDRCFERYYFLSNYLGVVFYRGGSGGSIIILNTVLVYKQILVCS